MHCPYCNALNPDDAQWCGLCLRKFQTAQPAPPPPQPQAQAPLTPRQAHPSYQTPATPMPAESPEVEGAWRVVQEKFGTEQTKTKPTWVCSVCEAENPIDVNNCTTCGTSIFETYKKKEQALKPQARGDRNPAVAGALSVLPGAGHLYLGLNADGVVRLILGIWWLAFGLILMGGPRVLVPIGGLIIVAFLGLAAISGWDAYRVAIDPDEKPVLNRTIILYSSLAVVLLAVFGALLTIVALRN